MATTHVSPELHDDNPDAHGGRRRTYVLIAVILAALTAMEVSTYYIPDLLGGKGNAPITVLLMFLMAVKFFLVVYFFMHLKYDKRFLTAVFYAGLFLALAVYIAVLSIFRFWGPPEHHMVSTLPRK